MDAVLRNIWVCMCCCCLLAANKIQTVNTGGASKDFINEYNETSQFVTSSRKISCSEKSFHIFIFYIYLKRMGLNLSTNLPLFVYTFQAMWRHRPLKEYSFFIGIRVACTFFSPYTLTHTMTHIMHSKIRNQIGSQAGRLKLSLYLKKNVFTGNVFCPRIIHLMFLFKNLFRIFAHSWKWKHYYTWPLLLYSFVLTLPVGN